jgi:acyl-CoA synthetase (AMP-forming)/AMP-acid ligase II
VSSWFTLGDVLREHRLAQPAGTAAVCGDARLSWADLDLRVDRVAAGLAGLGVEPGDRILWLGQNCHRLLELLLAAGRLGAACCPANWRQSPDEIAFVIDDLEPRVVVWQEAEIGERVAKARATSTAADGAHWIRHDDPGPNGYEQLVATTPPIPPGPRTFPTATGRAPDAIDPESPVLILYTAAFDGRPNGALLPHRALLAQALIGTSLGLAGPDDVYLNSGPLFHVGTFKATLATFVAGGTNVFTPRVDAEELCRLVSEHRCTGAFLQPPTMEAMVEANRDARYDLSTLRAKPGAPLWNAMVTVDDRALPRSGYGQTELAGVVTYVDPARPGLGAAGRPAPLARVEIQSPDGEILPPGQVGEIVVRGPMVMTGYHRRPELTSARARGGWHHTGDLGRREPDGSLTFVGSLGRLIKSAAENIYPAEVEGCLRSHPAVADAAVIGVLDDTWGQSVKAIVVPVEGAAVDEAELIAHCRDRIASYKKPRSVEFADVLPRAGSGFDYDALDATYGGGGYPSSVTPSRR